ncbi:MAG: PA14 domain-containing protein [Dehalococcoidia bacterium]
MKKNIASQILVAILTLALLFVSAPVVADSGLTSGFVKIKDWDETHEAFSFSSGQVAWGSGDFFISPRGIHVFESPGIIDMGLVYLDDVGEAPAAGYVEMAAPVDGHTYVVRSNGKYGKFYLEETYDWLTPIQYGISWVYQPNGTRSLGGAASTSQTVTSGQTGAATDTGCTYEQYIAAYNKLTYLMSQGKGDTPEAQAAYAEYAKVKACYESGSTGTGQSSTPATTTTTTPTTPTTTTTTATTTTPQQTGCTQYRIPPAEKWSGSWFNTGISLPARQTVSITASGTVRPSLGMDVYCGPEGTFAVDYWLKDYSFLSGCGHAALIARIGSAGTPMCIGTGTSFSTPTGGELWLGINDTDPANNSGSYAVEVCLGQTSPSATTTTIPATTPAGTTSSTSTSAVTSLSCANKDNEEKGCGPFYGAHTYLFGAQNVTSVVARFDTGRRFNCRSVVTFDVYRNGVWQTIKTVDAVSSSGNSEFAPIEVQVPVNDTISGFRISDGCVCCIDFSEITIYGSQSLPQSSTTTSTSASNVFGSTQILNKGFKGNIYYLEEGTSHLPDFSKMTPVGTIYIEQLDIPDRDFTEGFPGITNRFEWFGISYVGGVFIPAEGYYTFKLTSDDGAKLYIDGELKIDNDGIHPFRTQTKQVYLTRGDHVIKVDYFQGPRARLCLQLHVQTPGGAEDPLKPGLDPSQIVSPAPASTTTTITTTIPAGTALIAESRTVMTGGTVQVPIYFQDAQSVGSLGFTLSYDPAVLQVVKVSKGSLLAPATFTSSDQSGSIIFGFASPQAISGNGSAAIVEFRALGSAGSTSALTLSEILATSYYGSSLTVSPVNGLLTIGQNQPGDADGDGKLSVLDALIALKMYVKSLPLDLIADINQDGRVTPEDARLIMEKAKP